MPAERELLSQINFGHRAAAEAAEDVEVFQFFANKVGHSGAPKACSDTMVSRFAGRVRMRAVVQVAELS